ncbi:MAG: hypothetical protein RTU30_11775 [Candidatus Thorarchaeota archaeon]
MIDEPMLCRRLASSESKTWLNLDSATITPELSQLTEQYLNLTDSIMYAASVGGKYIGGTAVWRDRRRLGMTLASIRLASEFREIALHQLIKSSIPWFRSLSIREVDALAYDDTVEAYLRFPLVNNLSNWVIPKLVNIEFVNAGKFSHHVIETKSISIGRSKLSWDKKTHLEEASETLWRTRKQSGLDLSHAWLALHFAAKRGSLQILTNTDDMIGVILAHEMVGDTCFIGLIMVDEESVDFDSAISLIINSIDLENTKRIELPLTSPNQDALVKTLNDLIGDSTASIPLTLYRKVY